MGYTTGKRKLILDFLSDNADSSYTLAEVCDVVTKGGRGKSTVYRLVSELVGEGVIKRISDGRTRHFTYQFVGGSECHEHLHLRCRDCGRLVHLDERLTRELESVVERVGGFVIEDGAVLFGTCGQCAEVKI